MYFVSIDENRRRKPVEIVLSGREEGRGRMMERINLRCIVNIYINTQCFSLCNYYKVIKNFLKSKNTYC
jgi:hypothetical protein